MKVAFFLTAFPIISETFVLNQITGLIDQGIHVSIFVVKNVDADVIHKDVEKYKLLEKVRPLGSNYRVMPKNKLKRIFKAFKIYIRASKREKHILLKTLDVRLFGKSAISLVDYYNASTFIDSKQEYDILHCHFGQNGVHAVNLKIAGVTAGKVVTVFHGHDISKDDKSNSHRYANLFKHGDSFQPVSHKWATLLQSIGCPSDKIQVHRMGVELHTTQERTSKSREPVQILSVARMVEKKGLEYALRALPAVVKQHPKLVYKVAGDGPLREQLEALIVSLGLERNVVLLGWQDQADINKQMDVTDIFLLPSVTSSDGDMEGVPVVLMEAMQKSIPIISTLHSGIPELVQNQVSGILVEERNIEQLQNALLTLISDPRLRSNYGAAGRKEVIENYSIDRLNEQLAAHFRKLCRHF